MRLVLELGVEEIPARFIYKKEKQFAADFEKVLVSANVSFESVVFYATPRRLVFIAEGLSKRIDKKIKRIMGPPKNIAYENNDKPTKAFESFVNRNNIKNIDDIKISDSGKNNIYIEVEEGGELVLDVLKFKLKNYIETISFPKQMRWGNYKLKFVRPMRWIFAVLDDKVVDFSFNHLKSSKKTYGARFDGNRMVTIENASEYETVLADYYVIVDQNKRFNKIKDELTKISEKFNADYNPGDDLIWENVYLGEYCNVEWNNFDDKFLQLPDKVLSTSIAINQKYFTFYCRDDGNLLSIYSFVYEQKEENAENIKSGTLKVLRARLNDAIFFYSEDVKRGLAPLKAELEGLKFQDGLGTVLDKVNRIEKIYKKSEDSVAFSDDECKNIDSIINLFKNDLVTNMISEKEFTSLQGYMGKIYAKKEGYSDVVADAVEEHYFPRFSGDQIPQSKEAKYVAVFDKIDSIVGLFSIGKIPTGSNDPYSLRRQSIGVVRILTEGKLDISLNELLDYSIENFNIEDIPGFKQSLIDFFNARIIRMYQDSGYDFDVVDSVIDIFLSDHEKALKTMMVVKDYKQKDEFKSIIFSFKRINNILIKNKTESIPSITKESFNTEEEKNLFSEYFLLKKNIGETLELSEIFENLLRIEKPLTVFFDSVMVISENPIEKANRLALISEIRDLFNSVANFTKIVYEKK